MAPITVMTRGEAGALITVGKESSRSRRAKPTSVVDPTGAGDAFRRDSSWAEARLPWPVVGRLAAAYGGLRHRARGPQQHSYTLEEFVARYRENFGCGSRESPSRRDARPSRASQPGSVSACRNGSCARDPSLDERSSCAAVDDRWTSSSSFTCP